MRPAISLVMVCTGEIDTSTTARPTASSAPTISAVALRRIAAKSSVAMPNPSPMIGIISGDSNIAPISTATEGINKPSSEIAAEITIRNA